jgi:hypothetical protein
MTTPPKDFPWNDVLAKAAPHIANGAKVYQKFTCDGCGQRLTMETPNVFHETGTCDQCPTITNIKAKGCNFMLHLMVPR